MSGFINTTLHHTPQLHDPMSDWHEIVSNSIVSGNDMARALPVHAAEINTVAAEYPLRVNAYYLSLIQKKGDGVWEQAIPDIREIEDTTGLDDPLCEEGQSPVPHLTHRYPDRVLFLVSSQCAMYCRHCMRKRKVGTDFIVTEDTIREGIDYIRKTKSIRDVLISGGDPLMLEDTVLESILKRLSEIDHLAFLRIHTRMPCTLPQRITPDLCRMLKKYHPLYMNTHFNHPNEITPEARRACALLADSGIPLGCQTVLLKGVNDTPSVMKTLMRKLLEIRVRPYYLHHPDLVRGTGHFRTSIRTGIKIIKALRGHMSGMAIPHYVIDLPGGGGKIPLLPEYIKGERDGRLVVENFTGQTYEYPLDE